MRGKPRLPWKRGPVAFEVGWRADEIIKRITSSARGCYSLRRAAGLFGISTQPLRDWVRLKQLRRDGPRGQFAKAELIRFIRWLAERARPFEKLELAERFIRRSRNWHGPFATLERANFLWPCGRPALAPRELAELIGCHPSLIVKAIHHYCDNLATRRTPKRWEITRQSWRNTFSFSSISEPQLASLPRQRLFTVREAKELLGEWGRPRMTPYRVRRMIKGGELEGVPPPAGKRGWLVTRKSLEKMRTNLLTR